MTTRERVIQLVNEITALRQQLQARETELDSILPPDGQRMEFSPSVDLGNLVPGSIASRVLELLTAHAGRSFDAPTIAQELGIKNINSLRGTLLRMADGKRIQKASRGMYQARKDLRAVA